MPSREAPDWPVAFAGVALALMAFALASLPIEQPSLSVTREPLSCGPAPAEWAPALVVRVERGGAASDAELRRRLAAHRASFGTERGLRLRPADDAPFGRVVQVIDICRAEGFELVFVDPFHAS